VLLVASYDRQHLPWVYSCHPRTHRGAKATGGNTLHIDYIFQDQVSSNDWTKLIPAETNGFTLEGVQRLNDSIRTYVWAVLGAQGQTRSAILGSDSTRFDAQKQFETNVEDAINAPVDLPAAIARYQDALQYAGSQVNFAFGQGLYMSPSNMVMDIARGVQGYNNEILTSDDINTLGEQTDVNGGSADVPSITPNTSGPAGLPADDFAGKINPPNETTADVGPPATDSVANASTRRADKAVNLADEHADEKTAILLVGMALFAAGLYYWRGRLM